RASGATRQRSARRAAAPGGRAGAPPAERLLSLQRSAGNAAAAIAVQRQGPPDLDAPQHFDNAFIQYHYDNAKVRPTAKQAEALHKLDKPAKGPWAKLAWDDVSVGAAGRALNPTRLDKQVLGVCGEAAALEADAQQNAPQYADFVRHVFETGDVDGTKVNKTLLGNTVQAGMAPVDWMALSALQDASNAIRDYTGRPTE